MSENTLCAEELLQNIDKSITKWRDNNGENVIHSQITNILQENQDRIIKQLLGFKDNYGAFEIDSYITYNGGRESPVIEYLKTIASKGIQEWLENFQNSHEYPPIQYSELQSMKERYIDEYRKKFDEEMTRQIDIEINNEVSMMMNSVRTAPQDLINAQDQLKTLIKGSKS